MKIIIIFAACLCGTISSSDPEVDPEVVSTSVKFNVKEDHDMSFHQDVLAGGNDKLKQFKDLSPEDTAKEIRSLVSHIDSNGDGRLDKLELATWIARVEDRTYKMEADDIFDREDEDGDGFIIFEEYWLSSQNEEIIPDEELSLSQLSVYIRFEEADKNGDHLLDKSEFPPFIHPFRHENMIAHLIEDQLALYDHDEDGTISLKEYIRSFSPEEEPDDSAEWVEDEKVQFQMNLDLDHDGMLDLEEMRNWLAPNETRFHEEEALHLLHQVDKDKDDFLTVEEIESEFDEFIDSPVTDFGYSVHDEL